ncbi:MAG: hypothetical protein M1818_002944 [Claussenomyces sp. TS43310]|nr:MAG: hypothetical protein M1818_002944 [Claussenomyces sp. TS43310]
MASLMRIRPRLTTHAVKSSCTARGPYLAIARVRARAFSVTAHAWSTPTHPPPPPKEEQHPTARPPPTYIATTKRLPEFNLANKVVLVSGGARGLGLVQAEALLEAGAIVYALDKAEEPSSEFRRIQKRANEDLGSRLDYRCIDVRDVSALNEIIETIGMSEGRIDGLIAAAGINNDKDSLEYTPEEINNILEVNITGVFMTAQAVAKQMIKYGNGGSIVIIGSMSGTIANKGLICAPYNASKAGVLQLARNLAAEWGMHRIRVNTISPGYIQTSMLDVLFKESPERKTEWPAENMLGHLSRPEDYRGAAVFLISDASSYMTGADLRMDGGHASW